MINVTKSYLPPIDEIKKLLEEVYTNGWVTNNGPLVQRLEQKLSDHLRVEHFELVTNGTIALQIALKALNLRGRILTTPFSYVATLNSIIWEGMEPVFVDVNTYDGNVSVDQLENTDMSGVSGMVFTHVFGNPCDVERIDKISKERQIPVIYDAAHAFEVEINGKSVLNFGTMSTLSFHATKIFHSVEGGAIVCNTRELKQKVDLLKSFGHKGYAHFIAGINGKMSEIHAAFGLSVLNNMGAIRTARKKAHELYTKLLSETSVGFIKWHSGATNNYAYYPVIFDSEEQVLEVLRKLEIINVYPRRYFYPSLNQMPYVAYEKMVNSEELASRILCLPLSHDIETDSIERIVEEIKLTR